MSAVSAVSIASTRARATSTASAGTSVSVVVCMVVPSVRCFKGRRRYREGMQTPELKPSSAQRLITVISQLAEFDVVQSTEEDQLAVQEAVALTSPEHQR